MPSDAPSHPLPRTCPLRSAQRPFFRDPRRILLASIGVISTGLGVLGAFLPLLPTTVFLIVATWCFARSCPWLEQRLLRNRLFAPAMAIIDGARPFTTRMRIIAILSMWTMGGSGATLLALRENSHWIAPASVILTLLLGTWCILIYKRTPSPPAASNSSP